MPSPKLCVQNLHVLSTLVVSGFYNKSLGSPLTLSCSLKKKYKKTTFESERLDQGAGSKAGQSNLPEVQVPKSAARAIYEPSIPPAGDFESQQLEPLDVIFIAIDFEYSHYSPKTGRIGLREVGISMLDTRDLRYQNNYLKDVISTQHYRTVTDTKSFLFGESIDVLQDELVLILKRLFYLEDGSPKQTRNLILVGHGLGFKIKAIKGAGIDLNLASSVIEIFDTEFLGYEVFGKDFKCSLSNVVQKTGILGGFYHNVGNDANFSLRAMFLLACYRYNTLKANMTLQSSANFTGPTKVILGGDKTEFIVLTHLLTFHSNFFTAACSELWESGRDKTVNIADEDPEIFAIFLIWVFTGDLNKSTTLPRSPQIETALDNATASEGRVIPEASSANLEYLYTSTSSGSALRTMLMDHIMKGANTSPMLKQLGEMSASRREEFLQELSATYITMVRERKEAKFPWERDECVYHTHPGKPIGYSCTKGSLN
ncbi:hypothetical protein DL98DRAFT_536712 [Cadophora sp. DSE1049]|nr:hypothetical protein DL98DRAFT_536712 [Cadophora sp. DSE1049]